MRQSRCIGTILLGTVAVSVALATMKSDVKKPYGPKMCERLCNWIAGCSSYIYRMSDLSCHVPHAILQNQEKGIYPVKDTKRMHAENAVNCSEGDQIFRTRSYIIKCRPILPNLPTLTNKDDGKGGRMTRILMMPTSEGRSLQGRQLYLANNSIVTYPFLDAQYPSAIAYIPSQKKLVMATSEPLRIILVQIDAKEKTVIKTEHWITGIAIDDEKQLTFLSSLHGVSVMTTNGNNLTLLFSLTCAVPDMIVADSKRSLIYVLCRSWDILQFTYQGVPKGRVAEIDNVGAFILYMEGDILYYQTKKPYALAQVSLSDHSVTTLPIKIPRWIDSLLKIGDLLYMIPRYYTDEIFVVNMSDRSDRGTVIKLRMGFEKDVTRIKMCLIP